MKVATLEKFHLREWNQDPGDPGVGKVRGGGFFFLQAGGGLTLDDTMILVSKYTKCCLLIQGLADAKQAA